MQAMSGLSLEEENDRRVEHALEILEADVSHSAQSALHATANPPHITYPLFGVTACPTQTHKYSAIDCATHSDLCTN